MNLKCECLFSVHLSETFLILRRIKQDVVKNVCWSSSTVLVVVVTVQRNLHFPDRFSKNPEIPNFRKIRPVGAKLFHAGGRTDVTKLIVAFRDFANAPKNGSFKSVTPI